MNRDKKAIVASISLFIHHFYLTIRNNYDVNSYFRSLILRILLLECVNT